MDWFEPEDQYFEEGDGLFGPYSVGVEDERKFVKNSRKPPLSSVCRLRGHNGVVGTGVAVGPYAIATAAHNFFDGAETEWIIDPGFNREPISESRQSACCISHPGWKEGQNPLYDIGVLRAETALPAWIRPTPWSSSRKSDSIYVVGYDGKFDDFQLYDTGKFGAIKSSMIAHSCDTDKGQSGGPVFARSQGGHQLLAVHVGGFWDYSNIIEGNVNKAIFFRKVIYQWLRSEILRTES